MKVLFISWDGMLEPLGQSQVLPYLEGLAKDHGVLLVSYEKASDWADVQRRERLRARIAGSGIAWVPLRYHPAPATPYNVLCGLAVCGYLSVRHDVQIVHARSYIPAAIALALQKALGRRFVFDMRGFWADEKVDAGTWRPNSATYRAMKWLEKQFLLDADGVVSLTQAAVDTMRTFPYLRDASPRFQVITTCTNLEAFRTEGRRPPPADEFVLGYVGAVGAWDVFDEVVECFLALRSIRPKARLLVINRGGHDYINASLRRHHVPADAAEVKAVEFSRVPEEMSRMHAGIFVYKHGFSRAATAPTKLGEFLACGLPCLTRAGVGDVDTILESERVGVVLRETDSSTRLDAVRQLMALAEDPETAARCVAVARRRFALDDGVRAYDSLYRAVASPNA